MNRVNALLFVALMLGEAHAATFVRPETTRRYLHPALSERVGRRDLACQALDALLAYSVTAEGYVGERIHEKTPWFYPWSPNASGSARILKMLLDQGRADR